MKPAEVDMYTYKENVTKKNKVHMHLVVHILFNFNRDNLILSSPLQKFFSHIELDVNYDAAVEDQTKKEWDPKNFHDSRETQYSITFGSCSTHDVDYDKYYNTKE